MVLVIVVAGCDGYTAVNRCPVDRDDRSAAEATVVLTDPSTWHEAVYPPRADRVARSLWSYAANYSEIEWHVSPVDGQVRVRQSKKVEQAAGPRPEFDAKADRFDEPSVFAQVDDGWLVGFNHGEFGAAIYWFSRDGSRNYKISNHQIVDYVSTPEGMLAVEGLAHLGSSQGSLIRIGRTNGEGRWKTESLTRLPAAPYAVSRCRDGMLLITLSDSLVAVTLGDKLKIETLLADADWGTYLYPNSSALTPDERKLYIGMRQYVGEFDLHAKKLRFLIPGDQYLHKLSKEDEDGIRIQEGGKR